MDWSLRPHRNGRVLCAVILCALTASAEAAAAPQVAIQAQVDKAAVELGQAVTLTITVEGEVSGATLKPPQFPKALAVVAQSRSTNVSLQAGSVRRSVSLVFVLQPVETGTFKLGPFELQQGKETAQTEPIELTVKRPILPPNLGSGERLTL